MVFSEVHLEFTVDLLPAHAEFEAVHSCRNIPELEADQAGHMLELHAPVENRRNGNHHRIRIARIASELICGRHHSRKC